LRQKTRMRKTFKRFTSERLLNHSSSRLSKNLKMASLTLGSLVTAAKNRLKAVSTVLIVRHVITSVSVSVAIEETKTIYTSSLDRRYLFRIR